MIKTKVLEANLVRHCNNSCACCNHASAFVKAYTMPKEVLKRDLAMLEPVLHTSFFCLQGGEPLLHPDLLVMMDIAFESGIADVYGILTNGKRFPQMPEAFWQKCKDQNIELRCSVYGNLPQKTQDYAKQKAVQYNLNYRPVPTRAFFKIFGDYLNGESFYGCPWAACHTVHEGHFYICPLSAFWPEQFMQLPANIDGYPLQGTTEEGLNAFIHRKTPLNSCRKCTGGEAPAVEWHESKNEAEWLNESTV